MRTFRGLVLLSIIASLFIISSQAAAPVIDARCTTCEFTVGRSYSAFDFGKFQDQQEDRLSFSINVWVFANQTSGDIQSIVSRFPSGSTDPRDSDFNLVLAPSGQLLFTMGAGIFAPEVYGVELDCGNALTDREWSHVSLNVQTLPEDANPSRVIIYIDGVEACSWSGLFEGERNYLPNEPIVFSGFPNSDGVSTQVWEGEMDDIRIFSGIQAQQQIQARLFFPLTGTETYLAAYYNLDENGGNTAADLSPNAFNGTFVANIAGLSPVWAGSLVPLRNAKAYVRSQPIKFDLYTFEKNEDDVYVAVLNGPDVLFGKLFLYPNLTGQVEYNDPVQGVGNAFPVVYYYSTAPSLTEVDFTMYYSVSRDDMGNHRFSLDQFGRLEESKIEVVPPAVLGCDGSGGLIDDCDLCGGNDFTGCVIGPGDCNSTVGCNSTCDISNYRGNDAQDLNRVIVSDTTVLLDSVQNLDDTLETIQVCLIADYSNTRPDSSIDGILEQLQEFNNDVSTINGCLLSFLLELQGGAPSNCTF